jgi:hypothetical protein
LGGFLGSPSTGSSGSRSSMFWNTYCKYIGYGLEMVIEGLIEAYDSVVERMGFFIEFSELFYLFSIKNAGALYGVCAANDNNK